DGIQVTIEQSLGRSWSSVQKLKTPDSRYEVRTPSTVAVVRGTGFLTFVQQLASGGTQTTYQVDEGTLQVTATAGGTVSVPAGNQVTIAEGAAAPASATPIAPAPLVTSVCAATAPGRVFASGAVDGRADAVKTFARDNKATPVSLVFTEDELNQVVNKNAPSATQGVTLSEAKIRIDGGGIH